MLTYMIVLLTLAPWAVFAWATLTRVLAGHTGRVYRMQVEGAAMVLAGTLAKWIVYDPHFGLIHHDISHWEEWFDRGERGLFAIGVLLLLLGYVLERRPRRGLQHWPTGINHAAWTVFLLSFVAAVVIFRLHLFPGAAFPWAPGRIVFSVGCLPFAVGYAIYDRRARHLTEPE